VADYASQAVINTVLSHAFPDDPIVGEEDASDLRASLSSSAAAAATTRESDVLCARVVELADDVLARPPLPASTSTDPDAGADSGSGIGGGGGEREEWGLGRRWGAEALLNAIDRGNHAGGRTGRAFSLSANAFFFCLNNQLLQACGRLIRLMGQRGSCAADNTQFVLR
jgi:3'(2'), 5'-bisphosphate nucleotidase